MTFLPPPDAQRRLIEQQLTALREVVWLSYLRQQVAEALVEIGDEPARAELDDAAREETRARTAIARLAEVLRAIA